MPSSNALLLLALLAFADAVRAQDHRGTWLQLSWVHARAQTDTAPVFTAVPRGLPTGDRLVYAFESDEVSVQPEDADTLGLSLTHRLTAHLALQLDAGYPRIVAVSARGRAGPPGPLGLLFPVELGDPSSTPAVSQRVWSPVLSLQLSFRPQNRLQPFVSAGASYIWFTEEEVHERFEQRLDREVGQALALAALKPGPTHARLRTRSVWAPAASAGLVWRLADDWALQAMVMGLRADVPARFTLHASDGSLLSDSRVRVRSDVIATALGLSYRFF